MPGQCWGGLAAIAREEMQAVDPRGSPSSGGVTRLLGLSGAINVTVCLGGSSGKGLEPSWGN